MVGPKMAIRNITPQPGGDWNSQPANADRTTVRAGRKFNVGAIWGFLMRSSAWLIILALIGVSAWGQSPLPGPQPKRRVAVFDFDNAAVQGGIKSPFFEMQGPNLGKAAADLLINKLVQDGTLSVIERNAIDKLLAEQNLSNTERFDPPTAARLGKLLSVDVIILGTITHYDYSDKITGGGGTRVAGFGGSSTKMKHDINASVQISTRLVSPDTAEVLAVSQGAGEVNRKGVKVDVRDTDSRMMAMGFTTNNPTMNDCMDKAVAQLAAELEQAVPKLPPRSPLIEGMVADANEAGRLVLNVGERQGLKVGDRLQVWRVGKEIKDPATGKVLMRDDTLLGEAVVTTVNDMSSLAEYRGTEPVQVRDVVKSFPKQR
jgi:curli biogenesis system outer membrane secretion channel CsgG